MYVTDRVVHHSAKMDTFSKSVEEMSINSEEPPQEYVVKDLDLDSVKKVVKVSKDEVQIEDASSDNVKYLFTTKTCPNCKAAKEMLKDENVVIVDAEEEAGLVKQFGVMQAPTLVVVDNGEAKKFVNASNIKKYVESK